MRFLTDENWPLSSAKLVRDAGHHVEFVSVTSAGASDPEVIELATDVDGILLTFDRDFGELVVARGLRAPTGIVYFRLRLLDPRLPGQRLLETIASGIELSGRFTVIEHSRIRQRPLAGP